MLLSTLGERLRGAVQLLVTDRWQAAAASVASGKRPWTIWIDLAQGRDTIWDKLEKGWRYGVRRAERTGIVVSPSREDSDVEYFFAMCSAVSRTKAFTLPGSLPLVKELLCRDGGEVEARLFLARRGVDIGAGALVIRCGRSLHYMWGAVDRAFSKDCVGEAVQWGAVEWGLANSCLIYDLEGLDPDANAGTTAFKRKMGGQEVELAGKEYFPFGLRGALAARVLAARDR